MAQVQLLVRLITLLRRLMVKLKLHRTDYTPSEDDNVLVQGVTGNVGGMAYFGYGLLRRK